VLRPDRPIKRLTIRADFVVSSPDSLHLAKQAGLMTLLARTRAAEELSHACDEHKRARQKFDGSLSL
jgi:hypothetical protein